MHKKAVFQNTRVACQSTTILIQSRKASVKHVGFSFLTVARYKDVKTMKRDKYQSELKELFLKLSNENFPKRTAHWNPVKLEYPLRLGEIFRGKKYLDREPSCARIRMNSMHTVGRLIFVRMLLVHYLLASPLLAICLFTPYHVESWTVFILQPCTTSIVLDETQYRYPIILKESIVRIQV